MARVGSHLGIRGVVEPGLGYICHHDGESGTERQNPTKLDVSDITV